MYPATHVVFFIPYTWQEWVKYPIFVSLITVSFRICK